MPASRLFGLLTAILVLAIVVPYAAVRSLHQHRLAAANAALDAMGPAVGRALPGVPVVDVLLGPGRVPKSTDPRWLAGATYPLQSAVPRAQVTADPWGNAYVVNRGAAGTAAVWLLSAGPDGTLQTSFDGSTTAPLGDDLGRRLR